MLYKYNNEHTENKCILEYNGFGCRLLLFAAGAAATSLDEIKLLHSSCLHGSCINGIELGIVCT